MVSYRPATSYLCKFLENVNQSENIEGTCLLMDLLTKIIFSNVNLSPNLNILFGEKSELEWNNGRSWPLEAPCKDFNLAIGRGIGSMKWLKNGEGKSLYFMQLFMH